MRHSPLSETIEGICNNGRGDCLIDTLDGLLASLTTEPEDHAQREEEWLFPPLQQQLPDSPIDLKLEVRQAIREKSHRFGRWYRVWWDGDDSALQPWVEPALDLRGKIVVHMQKENLILFPIVRRVLTVAQLQWSFQARERSAS